MRRMFITIEEVDKSIEVITVNKKCDTTQEQYSSTIDTSSLHELRQCFNTKHN